MLASVTQASRAWGSRLLLRAVLVVVGLWVSGWLLHRLASADSGAARPGFLSGVAHGALMPMALPRLLLGVDATIYAVENSGRAYKLGYTCGVNACGALFFGFMYRRRTVTGDAPLSPGPGNA